MSIRPPSITANSYLEELGTARGAYVASVLREAYEINSKFGSYIQSVGGFFLSSGIQLSTKDQPPVLIETKQVISSLEELKSTRGYVYFPEAEISLHEDVYRSDIVTDKPTYPVQECRIIREFVLNFLVNRNPYRELSTQYKFYKKNNMAEYLYIHQYLTREGIDLIEKGDLNIEGEIEELLYEIDIATHNYIYYEFFIDIQYPNMIIYHSSDVRALEWMKFRDQSQLSS